MAVDNLGALQMDIKNQKWMRGHVIEVDVPLECGPFNWQHMSDASPVTLDSGEVRLP